MPPVLPPALTPQSAKNPRPCTAGPFGYVEQVMVQEAESTVWRACIPTLLYPEVLDTFRVDVSGVDKLGPTEIDFAVALGPIEGGGAWESLGSWKPVKNPENRTLCTIVRGVPFQVAAVWCTLPTASIKATVYFQVTATRLGGVYEVVFGDLVKPGM